jgi:hypothetical protein
MMHDFSLRTPFQFAARPRSRKPSSRELAKLLIRLSLRVCGGPPAHPANSQFASSAHPLRGADPRDRELESTWNFPAPGFARGKRVSNALEMPHEGGKNERRIPWELARRRDSRIHQGARERDPWRATGALGGAPRPFGQDPNWAAAQKIRVGDVPGAHRDGPAVEISTENVDHRNASFRQVTEATEKPAGIIAAEISISRSAKNRRRRSPVEKEPATMTPIRVPWPLRARYRVGAYSAKVFGRGETRCAVARRTACGCEGRNAEMTSRVGHERFKQFQKPKGFKVKRLAKPDIVSFKRKESA